MLIHRLPLPAVFLYTKAGTINAILHLEKTAFKHHKLIILGSGPAGYTAAVYAARANLNPVIITGLEQGAQLMTNATEVDNWPADADGVQGLELMARFLTHAERFGTEIVFDHIHTAQPQQRLFKLPSATRANTPATHSSSPPAHRPNTSACRAKKPSPDEVCPPVPLMTASSTKQDVAVVGGGNTAVEEALYPLTLPTP